MAGQPDVVVVGAGIAGGALGTVLAREGLDVVILERALEHTDRVRGEYMHPWGVAELHTLGLYDVLLAAGANVLQRMIPYGDLVSPEEAEANAVALALMPGVDGPVAIGHPTACNALDAAAMAAGSRLVRGVGDVVVSAGRRPTVTYTLDGAQHTISPRLVIGADGRESAVRKQLGLERHATEPATMGAGMLVEDAAAWSGTDMVIGTEGEWNFLVFPQGGGRARLYLFYEMVHKGRLVGADKQRVFLDAFHLDCFPGGEIFAGATPAGPCGAFPMNDTWVDRPAVDGVVLIGDAAGHSDPLIGQGLSIAMRDSRLVSEALLAGDDWSPDAFAGYIEERAERMRRLRYVSLVVTRVSCDSAPGALDRRRLYGERLTNDPELFMIRASAFVGPEVGPPGAFTDEAMDRLFAPA